MQFRPSTLLLLFLVLSMSLVMLVPFLLPSLITPAEVPNRLTCMNNLQQIGMALHDYHNIYHCFPPANITDKNGRPMHSWRVLILPYLGYDFLYKQYDFNEPWDSPKNNRLFADRPKEYACPSDKTSKAQGAFQTSYVAVVGPNAAWQRKKKMSFRDLHWETSTTVMVVEAADACIPWTEPKDLSLDALKDPDAQDSAVSISSKHSYDQSNFFFTWRFPAGANLMLADGSTRFIEP
jgi:hypothetical protein